MSALVRSRIHYHQPPGQPSPCERSRLYDQARQADKNFYSRKRWRKLRRCKLLRHPLCEECDRRGRITEAQHVHHKKPRTTHPDLAFEFENLESLCQPCHNAQEVR